MATKEEIRQENRKVRAFRILTDLTCQRLYVESMTLSEAREVVRELRRTAVSMFPDKGGVFDLVVAPRLDRVILERFGKTGTVTN